MNNYYLAASGKDTNDGKSRAMAWATWAYAKPKLVRGDVLLVYDGIAVEPQADCINVVIVDEAPGPPAGTALTLIPSAPTAGKSFSVIVQGGAAAASSDWVGVFPVGAPKTGYLAWKYLDNSQKAPGAIIRPAVVTLVAPAKGAYELRFLAAGSKLLGMVPFSVA